MEGKQLVNYAKKLGLQPLISLDKLNDKKEVYGIGWNGNFQKGVFDGRYVHFEQEFGGVKSLEKRHAIIKWNGDLVFPLKTVYSELYIK